MRIKSLFAIAFLFLDLVAAHAQQTKSSLTTEINTQFPDQTIGIITPAKLRQVTTDMVNSWQQFTSVNAQVGTTYTFQVSDYGKFVTLHNSSTVAATLPQAVGQFTTYNVYVSNTGSGSAIITPVLSTINGASSYTVAPGGSVWVVSDGTNYQTFAGSGGGGGTGTVTSVSIIGANGLTGSIANPTTTPAITLGTTITGLLKGNGAAISAASAGTDYLAPTGNGSGLTGIVWSQIGSTPTTLSGYGITDGMSNALTHNNFFQGNGSNIAAGVTLSAALDAAIGSTQGNILYRNSTVWTVLAPGTNGYFLETQGSSANPTWAPASGGTGCTTGGIASDLLTADGAGGCTTVTASTLTNGALTLGSSGTAGSVAMGNATSGTVTLQPVTGALGSVTASLPANSGTIAEINLAQTWSAAQTFTNADLKLAGSSSGAGTLEAPAAASTYVWTLPAATDQLIGRATTDTLTNKTLSSSTDVLGGVTLTLGSDATGDIYYRNSGGVLTRLGIGTSTQVLTVAAGLPSWAAASGGGYGGEQHFTTDHTVVNGDASTTIDMACSSLCQVVIPTGITNNIKFDVVATSTGPVEIVGSGLTPGSRVGPTIYLSTTGSGTTLYNNYNGGGQNAWFVVGDIAP